MTHYLGILTLFILIFSSCKDPSPRRNLNVYRRAIIKNETSDSNNVKTAQAPANADAHDKRDPNQEDQKKDGAKQATDSEYFYSRTFIQNKLLLDANRSIPVWRPDIVSFRISPVAEMGRSIEQIKLLISGGFPRGNVCEMNRRAYSFENHILTASVCVDSTDKTIAYEFELTDDQESRLLAIFRNVRAVPKEINRETYQGRRCPADYGGTKELVITGADGNTMHYDTNERPDCYYTDPYENTDNIGQIAGYAFVNLIEMFILTLKTHQDDL